jgi:hypothetical protein
MVNVPAVLAARAQALPAIVIVTTCPVVDAVQTLHVPVKPLTSATVGVAGMTNPDGNVTEIVLPDARAPVDEGVNPTVHVEGVAFAV